MDGRHILLAVLCSCVQEWVVWLYRAFLDPSQQLSHPIHIGMWAHLQGSLRCHVELRIFS